MALYVKVGTYTGDGSGSNRAITGIGFQPKVVLLRGAASGSQYRIDSMPATNSKTFDSFTALNTNKIVSLDSDGFTVGVDATKGSSCNFSATPYHYIALGGDSSEIATGTYTGDGTDDRDVVTSLSFQPDMVLITGSPQYTVLRTSAILAATDETWHINNTTFFANGIQQVLSNGFQVGTHAAVNTSADAYYWFAIKSTAGIAEVGTYTGDASSPRDITGVTTFQPNFVLSVSKTNAAYGSFKYSTMPSTTGLVAIQASLSGPDYVRGFLSDGFSIGSHINGSGVPFYFMAFKENAPSTSSSNFLMFM